MTYVCTSAQVAEALGVDVTAADAKELVQLAAVRMQTAVGSMAIIASTLRGPVTADAIEEQVRRMLEHPRGHAAVVNRVRSNSAVPSALTHAS